LICVVCGPDGRKDSARANNAKADATQDSLASIEAKMAAKKEISKKRTAVDIMKDIAQTMNELAQAGADVFKDPEIAN